MAIQPWKDPAYRTRLNVGVALALFTIGGVVLKRSLVLGTAIIVCGLITTYVEISARRER